MKTRKNPQKQRLFHHCSINILLVWLLLLLPCPQLAFFISSSIAYSKKKPRVLRCGRNLPAKITSMTSSSSPPLPSSCWKEYTVSERKCYIRSADWCRGGIIQIYRGSSINDNKERRRIYPDDDNNDDGRYNTHESYEKTENSNNNNNPNFEGIMSDSSTATTITKSGNNSSKSVLSRSARYLLKNYECLSERQRQQLSCKIAKETKASQPLNPEDHLHILYCDASICVVDKPSGVLSVPGPRHNPSVANLVHDCIFLPSSANKNNNNNNKSESDNGQKTNQKNNHRKGKDNNNNNNNIIQNKRDVLLEKKVNDDDSSSFDIDQMVVHRLDMDTSGIIVYALTKEALSKLHDDFRQKTSQSSSSSSTVQKTYEALVVGHVPVDQVEIDLALERDPDHPPFMRISHFSKLKKTRTAMENNDDKKNNSESRLPLIHPGFQKYLNQKPKPSLSHLTVLQRGYLSIDQKNETTVIPRRRDTSSPTNSNNSRQILLPVTRVQLSPITGRTHQLRVHCAAIGYPIVGDSIYGVGGEGDCGVVKQQVVIKPVERSLSQDPNDGPYYIPSQKYNSNNSTFVIKDEELLHASVSTLTLNLCLHSKKLQIYHPVTKSPLIFETEAPF